MTFIAVSVVIDAPVGRVWGELADLAAHVEWMADAESIEFIGDSRRDVGTVMRVETRVGPLRTTDVMEVTEWREGEAIGVVHRGLVTGSGRFQLTSLSGGTRVEWSERLSFPWWLGGAITARAARPILRSIWRRSLTSFKLRIEEG